MPSGWISWERVSHKKTKSLCNYTPFQISVKEKSISLRKLQPPNNNDKIQRNLSNNYAHKENQKYKRHIFIFHNNDTEFIKIKQIKESSLIQKLDGDVEQRHPQSAHNLILQPKQNRLHPSSNRCKKLSYDRQLISGCKYMQKYHLLPKCLAI